MNRLTRLGGFLLLAAAAPACTDVESPTELNPEGPPMVRQVFMLERFAGGSVNELGLAFGTHPQFAADFPEDDRVVTTGAVEAGEQRIRVVMDELLLGNFLEEIACRDGSWSRVPEGATPDDIANCSVALDLLPQTCPATDPHSVCIGASGPVGVKDDDENGSADDLQFIWSDTGDKAVRIVCTPREGGGEIEVPINTVSSFWQPSGNQQVPAAGGYNAIGPAIVLRPNPALPTNSDCNIVFANDVVDKDHVRPCTPPDGDITAGCEPGEVDLPFGSEVLRFIGSIPANNQTNVPLTNFGSNFQITLSMNTHVAATIDASAITVLENGVARTDITVMRDGPEPEKFHGVKVLVTGGLVAGATYVVQVGDAFTDTYGVPIPDGDPASITFTTIPAAN